MPGLNSSLNIGLSGLEVAQAALNVVGHNIANVNTPDYSRQRAIITASDSQNFGNLQFGAGVTLTNVQGIRNRFLDLQITQATSRQSGAETRYNGLEAIASAFQDDGTSGLNTLVQNFFNGFNKLASTPEDGSARNNLIGQAQSLVNGMQSRYEMLENQRKQADGSLSGIVEQINSLTKQIAQLNDRIATEPLPGSDNDARDQRQTLAKDLASLVGVQVFEDDKGRMQISLDSGAAVLVNGNTAYKMSLAPSTIAGNYQNVQVAQGSGAMVDITTKVNEGQLGAYLDLRDDVLPGYERKLDELAAGIASQVNTIHNAGFALNGTTGRDFFLGAVANGANGLPTTVTAVSNYKGMVNSLKVNSVLATDPSLIAAAGVAGAAGNNSVALRLAALQQATGTVDTNGDGTGDSGPYSTMISSLANRVGTDAQGFGVTSTNQDNLLSALSTQRDRASAVDLDEEATSLITFQRGYQAAARFISVIDTLTDQLVNQFGR
ncbi:MAG TPA: flagellar hook-associated protein FlgK [Holophaga sp.]|jgi:flagellar hook-associated protein 1 FlgK|nr:flagellar hook-associated protein FlgK [Holophaga sp.]